MFNQVEWAENECKVKGLSLNMICLPMKKLAQSWSTEIPCYYIGAMLSCNNILMVYVYLSSDLNYNILDNEILHAEYYQSNASSI